MFSFSKAMSGSVNVFL